MLPSLSNPIAGHVPVPADGHGEKATLERQ
jgi:hypothetical protein